MAYKIANVVIRLLMMLFAVALMIDATLIMYKHSIVYPAPICAVILVGLVYVNEHLEQWV